MRYLDLFYRNVCYHAQPYDDAWGTHTIFNVKYKIINVMGRTPKNAWDNINDLSVMSSFPKIILIAISVAVSIVILTCTGLVIVYFIKPDQGM